jgi:hypothetical protein
MECSASKISRLETGQIGSSPHDVREILTLYQVGDPALSELIEVAKETRLRGWWQQQNGALTSAYVAFEQAASDIRSYEAQCVPGLLQTEEYARNLIRWGGESNEVIESRIRLRMARRSLLTQEDPVRFWCVIDEGALLRPVGSPHVMREQLAHLATMSTVDNVTLQVLPLAVGAHPGMDGSFVVLGFPHESDPDTVYVTMATGGVFQEKPDELSRYTGIFARLTELALGCDESTALLRSMA